MFVLVLVILSVVILSWYWCKPRPRSPPMYPGKLPLIGHAHIILKHRKDLRGFMENVGDSALENGGIVQVRAGPIVCYVVNDPEAVGIIANTCLEKPYLYDFLINGMGNGLLTLNGDMWKLHHKLLSPSFNQQVLNTFLGEMNAQAQNLVSQLTTVAGKGPVDIKNFITRYILRLIGRTSLGLEAKDQDIIDNSYGHAIEEIFRIACYRALNCQIHPSFIYKWTAMSKREHELVRIAKDTINTIIQKRKSELKSTQINNEVASISGKFKPTLDLLLHLSDEQYVLSDDEIRAHLNTSVAASYDTTSAVLCNVLLALGSHPDVQERVYKEILNVFENSEDLSKYDMTKLVYLEAVIKEVLRVYTAVPLVARKIDADVVLPKYTLRAGSICVLSLYGLHRDSSWGPDVKQFKPERWLNPATLPTSPYVYAPFSIGKRNCIGKQYAMMSLKMSVAHVVKKFHITADISILKWRYEVVLKPTTTPLVNLTLRS